MPTSEMCAILTKGSYTAPNGESFVDASVSMLFTGSTGGLGYPGLDTESYPVDTVYRVRGSGITPVAAGGAIRDPKLTVSGDTFVLEGKIVAWIQPTGGQSGPESVTCTNERRAVWGGSLVPSGTSAFPAEWTGMTWSSNGHTLAPPVVSRSGPGAPAQIFFDVTGCGDGDPTTKDGFLAAFLPPTFVQAMGITQAQLDQADDAELAKLFAVTDNGQDAGDVRFTKETSSEGLRGVHFEYKLSFSNHKVFVRSAAPVVAPAPVAPAVPAAPDPPSKPSVKWASSKKKRTVTATVKLAAGSAVVHGISATKLRAKKPKAGKCVVDKKKTKATCTVKLSKGRWTVSVTPRVGTLAGAASSKSFKF